MYNRKIIQQLICTATILTYCLSVLAQVKWDGGGGDGLWMTTANWTGDKLPVETDEVVLDNTFFLGNYTVSLSAGSVSVTVKSITITPSASRTIELVLPSTNTAVPALSITGSGYGMTINNGGIFRNSSGADSSQPLIIEDSLRINNGGRYVQNSDRSHAAIAAALSKEPGTEEGIFEFDIPDASNTISLSGRTYGKLILSSNAAPGIASYTGSGTNGATINSDLVIGDSVNLSLNFSDTLFIKRDFIQEGGAINLGNTARKLVLLVGRQFEQSATGIISESGNAVPEIVMGGNSIQQINGKGTIQNSVAFIINNMAGTVLSAPLSLPYLLKLQRGVVTTTASNLLTLLPGSYVQVDSVSNSSFINGPLRLEGLSATEHYLLPVGHGSTLRWIALKNATGNFIVSFTKSDPRAIGNTYGTGIAHISGIEYWTIKADAMPLPSAQIELSFNDPNSGGVTDINALRVAWFDGNKWVNGGNSGVTGTAGSRGSVISNVMSGWGSNAMSVALASSANGSNPLPLRENSLPRLNATSTNEDYALRLLSYAAVTQVLQCKSPERDYVQVLVYSVAGVMIKSMSYALERGTNFLKLSMPKLPAGLYTMRAFSVKRSSNMLQFSAL